MIDKNHIILEDGSEYWLHPEDGWCANHKGAHKICEYCGEMWMYCDCRSDDKEEPNF